MEMANKKIFSFLTLGCFSSRSPALKNVTDATPWKDFPTWVKVKNFNTGHPDAKC